MTPIYTHMRREGTAWQTNPRVYYPEYASQKLHMYQNEKFVDFGVTKVVASDGFSGKIMGYSVMAIKNNLTIWWGVKRNLLDPWTIWPVKSWPRTWILFVSVSAGQSWSLSNQYPPPPFHSKSVKTKPCLWKKVGRNKRLYCINYPNKHALFYITNNGFLDMDDPFSKHCVSCIASTCCLVGLQNFVPAWNAQIIAQKGHSRCSFQRPSKNHTWIPSHLIPPAEVVAADYINRGIFMFPSPYGQDPLYGYPDLQLQRENL